jgi:hypothetical protein
MVVRCGPGNLLELLEDEHLEALVHNWKFKCGQDFEDFIFRKFRSSVHFPSSSPNDGFHLLVVFRCYTFQLAEPSVSLALHTAFGG